MKQIWHFLSSPYGLFVHFIFLMGAVSILLYKPITHFNALEEAPYLVSQAYTNIAPSQQTAISAIPSVEVGFFLDNFAEFDITTNLFTAEGIVWFIYNPNQIALNKLELFSFDKAQMLEKTGPMLTSLSPERTLARYHVRFSFTTNITYRHYPLDDHRLFIVLKNDYLLASDVTYTVSPENFYPSENTHEAGWKRVGHGVYTGYSTMALKPSQANTIVQSPQIVFYLDYDRSGLHFIITLLLPLLLLFFVALSVFLVRVPVIYDASNTFMGSLFALVGYLFVVESLAPSVGYLMLSDLLYFSTLMCTFIVATLSWAGNKLALAMRGLIGTCVELFLILLLYYVLHWWMLYQ